MIFAPGLLVMLEVATGICKVVQLALKRISIGIRRIYENVFTLSVHCMG